LQGDQTGREEDFTWSTTITCDLFAAAKLLVLARTVSAMEDLVQFAMSFKDYVFLFITARRCA